MKRLFGIIMVVGTMGLVACGGGQNEEEAASETARMDSIAQAEEDAAMAEAEAEQAKMDSIQAVEAAMADSTGSDSTMTEEVVE